MNCRDSLPAVADAPDQVRMFAGLEFLASPVRLEALDDLVHLMRVRGDDRIIAGLGQVLGLPVQRLHERRCVVDDHRFLVSQVERRIAVDHLDAGLGQHLSRILVFLLAAAARRIQHDAHLHAALMRADHRLAASCGSEKTNILIRSDFSAWSMASRIGLAESSGRTIRDRDIADSLSETYRCVVEPAAAICSCISFRRGRTRTVCGAARRRFHSAPSVRSWVPLSATTPPLITMIWSASRIVLSRCAMVITVRPFISRSSASITSFLRFAVERRGRFVQQQNRAVAHHDARNADALPLAAGECGAALADHGVVALAASSR